MQVEVRDPRLHEIIDTDVELEKIATGFEFTEGPVWHPDGEFLIFSDIVGDTMFRWSEAEGVRVLHKPSHMANGNTFDREGRLLTCEHATSRVTRTLLENGEAGEVEVMVSHYAGKELNSPNDIVVKSDGGIYFTDPTSGRSEYYGVPREQELSFQGVYRLDPDTKSLTLLVDDFSRPNGLCFSLDEGRLFVNDTDRFHIRVFDVQSDGTLSNGRVWAETVGENAGVPDGMKIDQQGNLYSCGPGGIHLFDAAGTCLGVIQMPEHTANLAWGGESLRSLYITASSSLYRLRVRVPGRRVF
ncbi:MAG: Gluconolactonase [Anaerolineales bacterium]|nr:Gluconolactonase [Anaerolineales bacterium]